MIGRGRTGPEQPLCDGECLVEHDAARLHRLADRREQIALQVARDHDEIECAARQRRGREVGAPASDDHTSRASASDGVLHGVEPHVDAERAISRLRDRQRVTAFPHRDVERSRSGVGERGRASQPVRDEARREIVSDHFLAQALLTAVGIGLLGLVSAAVLGLLGTDVSRHVTFGFFATLVTLLAHSMMMFYLIGKGKAVKDAMAEGGLKGDQHRRFAAARKPVFSIGTLAMAITMVAAILGASVDTGVLPPVVHAMIAYGAIAANLAAMKIEIAALTASARIVDEVNQLLGA
jgi:hypothetical protein